MTIPALDLIVAEGILRLLDKLQTEFDLACMFVTHDLATVRAIADDEVVMHYGMVVEQRPKALMFVPPHAAYTELLLALVPEMNPAWLTGLLAQRAQQERRCSRLCWSKRPKTAPMRWGSKRLTTTACRRAM